MQKKAQMDLMARSIVQLVLGIAILLVMLLIIGSFFWR